MARIRGKSGDDILDGKDKDDWVYGFGGNDVLSGQGGNDRLFGGDGNDVLAGGAGNDFLYGGQGEDEYHHSGTSDDGDDVIETGDDGLDKIIFTTAGLYDFDFERDGNDLIVGILNEDTEDFDGTLRIVNHYAGASIAFVQADLAFNDEYGTDPNLSTIYFTPDLANGINNTDSSEILIGTSGADVIDGNGGYFDYLTGGGGDDTIHGGDGFDNIRGGDGNDQLFGDADNDVMRGDRGDDNLDGGNGIDLVRYDGSVVTSGVLVDLSAGTAKDLDGDDANVGTDTLVNFENVRGSAFGDEIYGDDLTNFLSGQSGDDLIEGRDGDDRLQGDAGDDTLDGGAGNDTYVHTGFAALNGHDTIVNIDGVDTILFTQPVLYDAFPERQSDDLLVGVLLDEPGFPYDGTLTVKDFYASSVLGVFVQYSGPYNSEYGTDPDLATHFVTRDVSNGVENDTYTEFLFGSSADDIINGNGGFYDAIFGGAGNDTIHGGDGFDRIRGGIGDDTLYGDDGNDILRGDAGDDYIDGASGNDRAHYASGVMLSGVWVDLAAGMAKDLDGFDDSTGIDTLVNSENLWGSGFDDELYGDGQDNILHGDSGNDLIDGRDGNDAIRGGAGDDTLIGGDGDDSFEGGLGADSIDGGSGLDGYEAFDGAEGIWISLADGLAYNDGFGFTDAVSGIEVVYGSAHADSIQGDAADNSLVGNDGDDTLLGGDGNDFLYGGLGSDYIDGGAGDNETSFADFASEGVHVQLHANLVVNDGTGSSDFIANIWAVAGTVFDDLIEGDSQDNWLYGADGGNDTLVGLEGNDQLIGVDGDDLLIGGDGFDYLEGGTGADTFRLAGDGASDEVVDYAFGDGDVIDLSDLLDGGLVDPSNFGDFVQVGASAGGVDIGVDTDGVINGQAYNLAATLNGVSVTGQIAFNIDGTVYTYDNGAIA